MDLSLPTGRARAAAACLACAACLLLLYRVEITSGGRWLPGDILDARISIALEEHWFNVLRGLEAWNRPGYFYPAEDTLGYNDGYFLYGVVYSAFRAFRTDIFLADTLTGAVFRIVGFFGLLGFGRRICRLSFGWALLATSVTAISGTAYFQSAHIQLLTTGLAPCLAWLMAVAVSSLRGGFTARAVAWSCAAALLFDAWLLTAFYTAWFTAFFTLLTLAAAVATRPAITWTYLRTSRIWGLLPALAVFLAGLAPFILVYLPKARETGMHSFQTAAGFTPSVLDVVHFGTGNLLFGWLDGLLVQLFRPGIPNLSEQTVGYPPVLLCLALAGAALAFTRSAVAKEFWWRPLAVAFLASLVLCVHVGDVSLWRSVYLTVPGAAAVRVVSRYLLLLDLVAVLLACLALSAIRHRPVAVAVLAVLLLAEEVTSDGYYDLDRVAELRMTRGIPPLPAACKTVYVAVPRVIRGAEGHDVYLPMAVNVDGMLLAELVHRPTPNGHASFLPASFGMGYRDPVQYARTAPANILLQGIEPGLCGLDLPAGRWQVGAVHLPTVPMDQSVAFASAAATPLLPSGWSGPEATGRWTDGADAWIAVQVPPSSTDLSLTLAASAFQGRSGPSTVDVFANGTRVAHWAPTVAPQALQAIVPSSVLQSGSLRLRLAIADPASPRDIGLGADPRRLGLFVTSMRLTPGR